MTTKPKSASDEIADRMLQLLDVATQAAKKGDLQAANLALAETLKAAQTIPQKKAD